MENVRDLFTKQVNLELSYLFLDIVYLYWGEKALEMWPVLSSLKHELSLLSFQDDILAQKGLTHA